MAVASIAVDVRRAGDTAEDVEWVSLVAFGAWVDVLMGHTRGDALSVSGQMFRRRFASRNGEERIGWSLTVDNIVSARVVRPGGQRKTPQPASRVASSKQSGVNSAPRAATKGRDLPDDPVSDLWRGAG